MKHLSAFLFLVISTFAPVSAQPESPQQSLNQYITFMNQSVEVLARRFQMVQHYQADVNQYQKKTDFALQLPSSGPLEEYYYQKALAGTGLNAAEKKGLNTGTEALWQVLSKLDRTGKTLETYVRLEAYADDNLKQSDALIDEMQLLFVQFIRYKSALYEQIQLIYRRHQPYQSKDPYLAMEREMGQVLLSQQQLLDSLPCYLQEGTLSSWPVALIQNSMLADEKRLESFGKARSGIGYPASDAVVRFASELRILQTLKRRALDENTFAARQSARYGNEVYRSLLNQYNQGLLASYRDFVGCSKTARQLLDYPAFSPIFKPEPPAPVTPVSTATLPFIDKPSPPFQVKPGTYPASRATFLALNGYVDFINESLRQMRVLQVLLRNYQASAEYYRNPSQAKQRENLGYAHDDYEMPLSAYQLLLTSSVAIPTPYRMALTTQAGVLLAMLQEMDGLSIELISYTQEKRYLNDQLKRSDAILDRYAYLFATFDQKKEQLFTDVRRVYESYPAAAPTNSWQIAGEALREKLDADQAILFGVKAYFSSKKLQLPVTGAAETLAQQLIANEYQQLNGLKRYGRSNGLCPYSPYEDLAENTARFAVMAQKAGTLPPALIPHPYESFFYFYNNELVYQYNKFCDLAEVNLLKAINQPDLFAFRRLPPSPRPDVALGETIPTAVDEAARPTLTGFAPNNMVLLLDVSGSMDSPMKLPLLKRSIKSLLTLLRAEDQLSIVVYSGKARVVLEPTSGAQAAKIARIIDGLRSDGETDGNGGLWLAYKTANKNYLNSGNNRIILATDGEFPVSDKTMDLVRKNAQQDIHLTVFTFGHNPLIGRNLQKLSQSGGGTYAHVTAETADLQLILEAQAKKSALK